MAMIKKRRILKMSVIFIVLFVSYNVFTFFAAFFENWNKTSFCDGNFIGYENKYAKLLNAGMDPAKGINKLGGENISKVLNQPELAEFFNLSSGFFAIKCNRTVPYYFRKDVHLSKWVRVLKSTQHSPPYRRTVKGWTIAVTRFEYANMYHTMTDYYNIFKLMKFFNIPPSNLTVLFVDAHPASILDDTWKVLFRNVVRVGTFKEPTRFETLVWGLSGYDSLMNRHSLYELPYVEEFKRFFLQRHQVFKERILNCRQLNILIIFRHDYVAHPRNPKGSVWRKIKNEQELVNATSSVLPGHYVKGQQLELLDMNQQLKLITNTDILIGMHGAGLTHALFLPKHAGVVELFPTYWNDRHFKAISRWRRLRYASWKNLDAAKELAGHYTIVNADSIAVQVLQMATKMCKDHRKELRKS